MSEGRKIMVDWVIEALEHHGGRAAILDVAKHVWELHEVDIRANGDLLYEWQYELRWAGDLLRRDGKIKPSKDSPRGVWEMEYLD